MADLPKAPKRNDGKDQGYPDPLPVNKVPMGGDKKASNHFQSDQPDDELNKRGMASEIAREEWKKTGLRVPKNSAEDHKK